MTRYYAADKTQSAGRPRGLRDRVRQLGERASSAGRGRFTFDGETYRYLSHPYNATWRNERTVEVPIALAVLRRHSGGRVLELGNVLAYYDSGEARDVIDKYEPGARVIEADVADFSPSGDYDLVISVSTLEHVGWDEPRRDPEKSRIAVDNMSSWLAPGGELFVTFPLGHNDDLDGHLWSDRLAFDDVRFLKRINRRNVWREIGSEEARAAKYDTPYPNGNAIAVGRLFRK